MPHRGFQFTLTIVAVGTFLNSSQKLVAYSCPLILKNSNAQTQVYYLFLSNNKINSFWVILYFWKFLLKSITPEVTFWSCGDHLICEFIEAKFNQNLIKILRADFEKTVIFFICLCQIFILMSILFDLLCQDNMSLSFIIINYTPGVRCNRGSILISETTRLQQTLNGGLQRPLKI